MKKDQSKSSDKDTPQPLVEGVDFYMEKGMFVLTKHYLEKRGYCCDNGCRHCPYKDIKNT